jgi:transposase
MHRYELTDEQWQRIADQFPANGRRGGQWLDHRRVVNGIFWILSSGAPWRDLPECRSARRVPDRAPPAPAVAGADGTWERLLRALRVQADERGLIDWEQWNADSTSVRATRHAAGARKKGGRSSARSRRTTRWA